MLYIPFQGLNFSVWVYIEGIILIVTYSLEHDLNTGLGGVHFFFFKCQIRKHECLCLKRFDWNTGLQFSSGKVSPLTKIH